MLNDHKNRVVIEGNSSVFNYVKMLFRFRKEPFLNLSPKTRDVSETVSGFSTLPAYDIRVKDVNEWPKRYLQ